MAILNKLTLAKRAFTEANRLRKEKLEADAIEDAKYYITQAYKILKTKFSYDPELYATPLVEEAVVAYAKNLLLDRPGEADPFPFHAQTWANAAAVEVDIKETDPKDQLKSRLYTNF